MGHLSLGQMETMGILCHLEPMVDQLDLMGFQLDLMELPHCILQSGPLMRMGNQKIGPMETMAVYCLLARADGLLMMAAQLDLMEHHCRQMRMGGQLRQTEHRCFLMGGLSERMGHQIHGH
jgi:hypothetical protein